MIPENIDIRPFGSNDLAAFTEMFCIYFRNDLNIEITDNEAEKVCSKIARYSISGIISLDVLFYDRKMAGFIIYQIDTPSSDWCKREGWGFIREIHVNQDLRKKGLASLLVIRAEKILYNKGVKHIYLTSDTTSMAQKFWISCGYKKTGKICEVNHCPIYEK